MKPFNKDIEEQVLAKVRDMLDPYFEGEMMVSILVVGQERTALLSEIEPSLALMVMVNILDALEDPAETQAQVH